MDSTMSSRRPRKQPDRYGKLIPSNEIPSDCELDNEDTDTAECESETSEDSSVSNQGPWAESSDDEQTQERPGRRRKRRSTAAAAAVQPASKKAKVAQQDAPWTASSRQGRGKGGCKGTVMSLPDGRKAVETEIATSTYPSAIYLPSAFGSECFPNLSYDVHLIVMVDDQLADLGVASGHVRRYTTSRGYTQHHLLYKTGLWNSYPGHVITKISTNSSSSELTCHLMSPARQQAGTLMEASATASAAAAGQTYWFEQQGTGRALESLGRVYLPLPLLQKMFRPALLTLKAGLDLDTPVMVVVANYKDNELASRTSQPLIQGQRQMIYVPPKVRRQLAGFKLVRFRAAKPNLLEVYFSSEDTQEPATAAVAPVPLSNPSGPSAALPNNQQAGTPPAGIAAVRMPSATAALAKQQAPPTPIPRAPTASAVAAARVGSSGGLPRSCDGGFAAGKSNAAAASSAEKTADAAAAATAGAHSNISSRRSIQLAAAGAVHKAAAAAGVTESRDGARANEAKGVAVVTSRPGTTPAQQARKQVAKHVSFDLPAANCGKAVSSNKEAGTGFGSHNRPELQIASSAVAVAANIAASKIPVVAAGLQMAPKSAPKVRVELSSTAARRANGDAVQGSASRSSTKHRAKAVLQEQQQLGMQQQTGTPAGAGMLDLTISSDEETDKLPERHPLNSAVPGSVSRHLNKKNYVHCQPNTGIAQPCSIQQSPAPRRQSASAAAAGTSPVARTVPAAPRPGLCRTAAVKTVPAAAAPGTGPAATAAAPAAPATLGIKLEAHTAVHDPTRSMPVSKATAADDRTGAAGLPAGFSLGPFRSVPLAFHQLVLLLEALTAPDELMQQLQAAAQAMIDAEGAADWSRKLELLEMHYCIVQAYVRRGRADLALDSVGVLLNRAVD